MGQTTLGESKGYRKEDEVDDFRKKYRGKQDNLDEVRHIEGAPTGEYEDIHRISNPPYYTAYPNPHIKEFIEKFGKPYDEKNDTYHRAPFVGDVREGKNNPIYNAYSYHTKVPHKAIMGFISHYTNPGDLVFDGFCGTGMVGVAAQLLGRRVVLIDICPIATFIAYNFNVSINLNKFVHEAMRILAEVEEECGWLYCTCHSDGTVGKIDFTVYSDVFKCPYCRKEFVYWDLAVDEKSGKVKTKFNCSECDAKIERRGLKKALDDKDNPKQALTLIRYRVGQQRFEKKPDNRDINLIKKIEKSEIPYWCPTYPMMFIGKKWGDTWRAGCHQGIRNVNDFYTKRNIWVLSSIYDKIMKVRDLSIRDHLLFLFTSQLVNISKLNRFRRVSFPYNPLSGTLYVGSTLSEANVITAYRNKIKRLTIAKKGENPSQRGWLVSTQSATDLSNMQSSSVDYIFTDPPFGDNLMYSELNFLYEAWLKVFTNIKHEAIINNSQGKQLPEYRKLMLESFKEMYRVLKPNRWITVEFHNSKASVWNAIQESLAKAGFVIAQVATLDKKQGSFKQVTATGAVKNDLIINAYKPKESFTKAFSGKSGYGLEREFIEQHLERLPIDQNIERTGQMLYSKMLAYYIQHGYEINMDAKRFYSMLREHFEERDGYWFFDSQVDVYEKRKKKATLTSAQTALFVSDERSAIQWLSWFLSKPKGYDEIYPEFVKALTTTPDKIPELKELLEENFVSVDGKYRRPRIMEKDEIEEQRNKRLQREFEGYLEKAQSGRELSDIRKEAVLAGFTLCYQEKRFKDILTVAERLPRQIIESSTEVYDIIDVAKTKVRERR